MITIIQERTINYILGPVITIIHDTELREVKVKYENGDKITYYDVKEIRFKDD